jgi:hypothetical protein
MCKISWDKPIKDIDEYIEKIRKQGSRYNVIEPLLLTRVEIDAFRKCLDEETE